MMRLTDNQLFAYLDGGEDDPFVAEMLNRDADARTRLALIRRVRAQLGSVAPPLHEEVHFALSMDPRVRKRVHHATPAATRKPEARADRSLDEFAPLAAFLEGKAERRDLGEIRIPLPSDADPGPQLVAELRAGRHLVEVRLFRAGESPMLRVCIRERDEGPVEGARANLLSAGDAVQRFTTDEQGVLELPVPAGHALLRLELDPTTEIRLVPATDL